MALYLVGIAVAIGFAALLWRQHKSGSGWQHEVSFFVDLLALSATALIVGVLVMIQLNSTPDPATAGGVSLIPPTATWVEPIPPMETAAAEATATSSRPAPPAGATESADLSPGATRTPRASQTPAPTPTPRVTPTAEPTATPEPTPEPTATAAPTATPAQRIYVVQQGDVLSAIAKRFGVSTAAIVAANPGINPESLRIDQELIIPSGSDADAAPPAPSVRTYTVQQGDTLGAIANRFGVTVEAIIAVNPDLNPDSLQIDQVIRIPN